MTQEEQDAVVLSALPGNVWEVAREYLQILPCNFVTLDNIAVARPVLQRLKRAGLARYDRQTRRWVRVEKDETR